MRLRYLLFIAFLLLLFSVSFVTAQEEMTCPAVVEQALTAVGENCSGLERNNSCYGYNRVDTQFVSEIPEDFFSTPSDRAPLIDIVQMHTAPMDIENETWGIAVMNVQANVPNTLPGQAVTFILLGNTVIDNEVPADEALLPVDPVPVVVVANTRVNLRSGGSSSSNVIGTANPGETLQVDGQNESGDWVRIVRGDSFAWISRSLVNSSDDNADALAAVPVVTGSEALTPMQSFYFSTGIGVPGCVEAPDLLVIQGPKETRVNLTVNGAEISVGSSIALFSTETTYGDMLAFDRMPDQLTRLQTDDDTECRHTRAVVFDGSVLLNEAEETLPTGHLGEQVTCRDEEGNPLLISEWANIERLSQSELAIFGVVENIPAEVLRYPITIPSDAEIDAALRAPTATPTRRATIQPRPTQAGGGQTNPTQPAPTQSADDPCAGFRATSPFGTLEYGNQAFYWDPVSNASTGVGAYQLDIKGYRDGAEVGSKLVRVGANVTTVNVNLQEFQRPTQVTWFVQALVGAEPNWAVVCQTATTTNQVNVGGGGQQPTPETPPTVAPVDPCAGFRATSPFGPVNYGNQDFYWDAVSNPATGVGAYQLDIRGYRDGVEVGSTLVRVGANVTGVTVNIQDLKRPTEVVWFVQALVGTEPSWSVACQTPSVTNTVNLGG